MADAVNSIIGAIQSGFAGVPRGRITIHEAEVIDDYGSDVERREARELDTEDRWEQVPDADIKECTAALSHLDPDGWRYYLPAYLIWSLRNFRANDSVVSDFTIYAFSLPNDDEELREYKLKRFRQLNQEQSIAVCRFLRFMAANDGDADARFADLALDEYWGRYCKNTDALPEAADIKPN